MPTLFDVLKASSNSIIKMPDVMLARSYFGRSVKGAACAGCAYAYPSFP